MTEVKIKEAVKAALEPIVDRVLHPEKYNARTGAKLTKFDRGPHYKPRPPRDRIAVRLILLCALKQAEIDIMNANMADQEAIEDVKAHRKEAEQHDHGG